MSWHPGLLIPGVLLAGTGLAAVAGRWRWRLGTRALHRRLEAARQTVSPACFDVGELAGLPAPVQRYFRAVLREGQPMIAAATLEQRGRFNLGEAEDRWRPFTATQQVVTRRPGFDWDARVRMLPGMAIHVHDAYIAGEGTLQAAALGLLTVADSRTRSQLDQLTLAQGELLRFLAEAVWYPTALLPSQGVHWDGIDEHTARATLVDGATRAALQFRFNEQGLVDSAYAEQRGRTIGDWIVPTPWLGRFGSYAHCGGMCVPFAGEVSWLLAAGEKPYWRGQITRLSYEFSP